MDLGDDVRVTIAAVQLAGLPAIGVLKVADATKAIADRANWWAGERHWVREDKLPRCGWMPVGVRPSDRSVAPAPEQEAERLRLEAKRAEVRARRQDGVLAER